MAKHKKKLSFILFVVAVAITGCRSTDVKLVETKIEYNQADALKISACSTYDEGVYRVIKEYDQDLNAKNFAFREDNDLFGIVDDVSVQLKLENRKISYVGLFDEKMNEIKDKGYSYYIPYIPNHLKDDLVINKDDGIVKIEDEVNDIDQDIYISDSENSAEEIIPKNYYKEKNKIDSIKLEKVTISGITKEIQEWEKLGAEFLKYGKGIPGERMEEYLLYQEYLIEKEKLLSDAGLYIEEDNSVENGEVIKIGGS